MSAIDERRIEVRRVRTRRDWQRFHAIPARVRRGPSRWIRPLRLQARQLWAPRHPYFDHAEAAAWLALRDGEPVGRISAQVDRLQAEQGRPRVGQFGQLEAIDDTAVFGALLRAARAWLAEAGMTELQGPFDLSINHQCGLLVEGFERRPMMMMNHNPAYYADRLEEIGLRSAAEMLAYRGSPRYRLPERVGRLLARMGERLETQPVAREDLAGRSELMRSLFNAAWRDNWGFVPLTEAEFRHMVGEMKLLLRPGYVQLAFFDGRAAGFIVALPDFNELIDDLDGRLFPTGAVRLLWRIARRRNRRARIPLMGIDPAFQQSLSGAAIAYALIEAVRAELVADGIEETEQSWILRQNKGMRSIVEAIGMDVSQVFRIYAGPVAG